MNRNLHIIGGKVYDPAHQIAGQVRDLFVQDGKMVDALANDTLALNGQNNLPPATLLNVRGCIIMPGGVEMHAHIASMAINTARDIQTASGYQQVVPTAPQTGELYTLLGYTTAIEPAVSPAASEHAHMQLDDIANLDTGLLTLMGNHEGLIDCLARQDQQAAFEVIGNLLRQTRAYGFKAVNPAAVAAWRRDPSMDRINTIDDCIPATKVSPRQMLQCLIAAGQHFDLPHGTHIHGPQLGEPGNVKITLEMIQALKSQRYHLAHLQYYAYGKTESGQYQSEVRQLLKALKDQPKATADLGLVAFGPAVTATADLPLEVNLYEHAGLPGRPASFYESGNEDCFGVMPLVHRPQSLTHAMQWATGLELALLWDNPWQHAMSIDHPNGGSFLNYPLLIAQLMSKPLRDEQLAGCHPHASKHTTLGQIKRELSLEEVAILTRSSPARILGLANKGHLGPGGDADITIYENQIDDLVRMFQSPRHVIKAGKLLVKDHQLVENVAGRRLCCSL